MRLAASGASVAVKRRAVEPVNIVKILLYILPDWIMVFRPL
jgi:hypothetical protein